LNNALGDRSAMVRRAALDGLILHRHDARFGDLIARALSAFREDASPSIRGRVDFLRRHMS
jgi:hypothetical protein